MHIQLQAHLDCLENIFHFDFEEKKALTSHGLVLATLVSQTTFLLRLVFAAPRDDLKKHFLLYLRYMQRHAVKQEGLYALYHVS